MSPYFSCVLYFLRYDRARQARIDMRPKCSVPRPARIEGLFQQISPFGLHNQQT